ncbi:MAG: hypothetical protein ABI977_18535 [Acidobacteriota bacterium]
MKTLSVILFACVCTLPAFGQRLTLNGTLKTDGNAPVLATRISLASFESTTDAQGRFKLALSGDFSEGERVIIKVIKPNWVINYPLDGEWNLPNVKLQNIQTLDVIIVPKGSKALWTNARIEKYVAKLSDEITKLKKEGTTPQPVDFGYYLSQWANQFGFTPEQVKAAFDEWSKAVEHSEDFRQLGLRAFYEKNFAAAAANFDKAARKGEEQIKQVQKQLENKTLETYEDWKQAGNSYYNLYNFREAIGRYANARNLITKEQYPEQWGEILNLIGKAKTDLGEREEAVMGMRLLEEAVMSFREALIICTRDQWPQQWAATQNNLGTALRPQGERMSGEASVRLLVEAVTAFRNALQVYTREQLPQDWAMTQNNLGNALRSQGVRMSGDAGVRLLAEAVTAYRNALQVRTHEQWPQDWAMTQSNLGIALSSQGARMTGDAGVRLLAEAVTAYRNALQFRTREQLPQQWAATQNNLGTTLRPLGERMGGDAGVRLLAEAVTAFRNALQVYTREQLPQDWAMTQNNLGAALRSHSERMGGDAGVRLLAEAVTAYRNALQVRTREQLPQQWAATQNNLGASLSSQGERMSGEAGVSLLAEAVTAYRNALQIYTREQLPQQWAVTQDNLGTTLRSQGERMSGEAGVRLLAEAVVAHRNALQVRTREQLPQQWAATQNNLGRDYYALQDWDNAAECYASALTLNLGYEQGFQRATGLYHETLFKFSDAFELRRHWLEANHNDLSVLPAFAENYFSTGRFADCQERIVALLAKPEIDAGTKIALRMIEIANLLALGQAAEVLAKLDQLSEAVAAQPVDFKITRTFNGTLHFIGQNEKLAPYREWLRQLFNAAQAENRDAILKGLREAKATFK